VKLGVESLDEVKIVSELEIDNTNGEEEGVFALEDHIGFHSQNY
jgi:hypothetical protein